ncbi:MAG: hypothetical protein IZT59_10690 [Verrucomicrobia bacterium]|nr:hypothetical protein [Verrucomicrobiota bacterium]|tara:strand:- start:15231 stop:15854 length:624 start_codon:yes stop_codon:yes gene_type:complete
MSDFSQPPQQRDFFCNHCNGRIVIPFSLPSTTGPCPHCQGTIVSPPPPEPAQAPALQQARVQALAPQQAPVHQPAPSQVPSAPRQAAIPARRNAAQVAAGQTQHQPTAAHLAKKIKASSGIIPAMFGLLLLILAAGAAEFYITNQMGTNVNPPNLSGSPEDKLIREATVELVWTGQTDNPTLEIKRFICWEFLGLGGKEIPATASNQ